MRGVPFRDSWTHPLGGSALVAGSVMPVSNEVKIVGVLLDSKLTFNSHVNSICSASRYHIQALRHIRSVLDQKSANTLACSTILSKLDYCNSLLSGVSQQNIIRLQRIQNSAARVVCAVKGRDTALPLLKKLHWLPVSERIDFKIALITFKALSLNQPVYIRNLLSIHTPARSLRSSSCSNLSVPFSSSKLYGRAFEVYAPVLWNSLPNNVKDSVSQNISVDMYEHTLNTIC